MPLVPESRFKSRKEAEEAALKGNVDAKKDLIRRYTSAGELEKAFMLRLNLAEDYLIYARKYSNASYAEHIYCIPYNERGSKAQVYMVAEAYLNGTGVKQSVSNAIKWYKKCIDFEFDALVKLAEIYLTAGSLGYKLKQPKKARMNAFAILKFALERADYPLNREALALLSKHFSGNRIWENVKFYTFGPSVETAFSEF